MTESFSVAVLAGGQSKRMDGSDKAFLLLKGIPFITRITREMRSISDDIYVIIGSKDENIFRIILDPGVEVRKDRYNFDNPVSGMLTACECVTKPLVAILACDLPLVKADVIKFLAESAQGHSAAVPVWENGNIEPLCAVYNCNELRVAALTTENRGARGCKNAVKHLKNVSYIPVSELRSLDEDLGSLFNVNSKKDFERLV